MALLCTQEELDEMCRNGTELVHEAIDSGDSAVARAEFDRIVEARTGLVDLMIDWGATAIRWVLENHGPEEMAKCFEPDLWLEIGLRAGITDAETAAAALALHDYRIDWATATINDVYRRFGAEGLFAAQLECARADWWHGRMEADLAELDDPVARVRNWSFFLGVGNWGTVSVHETEEAFVIHHQVCGSCGRQELRGCLEEPLNFPRVTEEIPGLNFSNPLYSVYRTHLAVWHFVMPIADVGHPWPAINCSGVPGRCWFTIYKDPHDTPASYYERAGLEKPARA